MPEQKVGSQSARQLHAYNCIHVDKKCCTKRNEAVQYVQQGSMQYYRPHVPIQDDKWQAENVYQAAL